MLIQIMLIVHVVIFMNDFISKNLFRESQPRISTSQLAAILGTSPQAVHKRLKAQDIKYHKIGGSTCLTHSVIKKLFSPVFNKKKIAFQIVKGGTGKTTALHNISCAASLYGAKVLTVDMDPQGNLTDAFNIDAENSPTLIDVIEKQAKITDCLIRVEEGIDLIPSRIENVILDSKLAVSKAPLHNILKLIFEPLEKEYDFIMIDCPPMMGHSVTAVSLYVDLIIVPLNPDKFSAKGLKILREELQNLAIQYDKNIDYKVFLNKFSGNTILSDKAIQTVISLESENGHALTTAIRHSQEIPNATDAGMNLFSASKKSIARDDFDLLTKEILGIDMQKFQISRI